MSTATLSPAMQDGSVGASIRQQVDCMIDDLMTSLPNINELTSEERRGIIARYTAVLEGNFIYWMTATLLATQTEEARPVILDNLNEEVRDAHPVMLRKFAIAAGAFPNDIDALAIDEDLNKVRRFLGRLSGVQSVLTMAFFEGFIQRFMSYLADLAIAQGSTETEYTDVHGVCDIAHSEGLFQAFAVEMEAKPLGPDLDLFEGVDLLRNLVQKIVFFRVEKVQA
jgi:DNA-binding Lrp family transcriptional regulator